MWPARLTVIALLTAGGAGVARSADDNGNRLDSGLELCIQSARLTDATCAKLTDDPAQRLDCFQKARTAQLDCLEHALAEAPSGATTAPEDHASISQPEPPASTGSIDAPAQAALPRESHASAERPSQENAPGSTPSKSEATSSEPQSGSPSPKEPAKEPASAALAAPQVTPEAIPSPQRTATPAAEAAAVQPDAPKTADKTTDKANDKIDDKPNGPPAKPLESSWVISETTSPVDYRPLLAAVIRPTSSGQGGPSSLTVRCRGGQTELSIHTEGTWHAPRKNALPVDHQINDQSTVRQKWSLSADAKTAIYADDAVELLRSLPDGARLTVSVPDEANARHGATFLLAGWDVVRRKIEAACKWPHVTDQASSGKR